jgi:hypothetical protein
VIKDLGIFGVNGIDGALIAQDKIPYQIVASLLGFGRGPYYSHSLRFEEKMHGLTFQDENSISGETGMSDFKLGGHSKKAQPRCQG